MFLFCFGKERFFLLLQVWEFMRRDLFLIFSFWATNCFLYFLEPSNLKPQWPKIYWAPRSKSTEAKIIGTSATLAYPQRKTSDHTDKPFVPSGSVISHPPPTHTKASQASNGLPIWKSPPCLQSQCSLLAVSSNTIWNFWRMIRWTVPEWHCIKLLPWHPLRGKRKLFNDWEPKTIK